MEKLETLAQYKEMLSKYRKICRNGYSNNYLSFEAIKRYISLNRIYFDTAENYFMIYTDEEKYYRAYVYMNQETKLHIKKMDKPILIRTIYKKDDKLDLILLLEKMLREQQFELYDKIVQICAKPLEMKEEVTRKLEKAQLFLKRAGIYLDYACAHNIPEIMSLKKEEEALKDYHFLYETEDEIKENVERGYYRCAFNMNGEICAAQQFSVENYAAQGNWLAVKEQYKIRYGIGYAMAYHSFMYAIEHDIPNYFGWVACNNEKSLKYHREIGYEITDKYSDEWVLI